MSRRRFPQRGFAVLRFLRNFLAFLPKSMDHRQPNGDGGGNTPAQVNGMKAGDKEVKRRVQAGHNVQGFVEASEPKNPTTASLTFQNIYSKGDFYDMVRRN